MNPEEVHSIHDALAHLKAELPEGLRESLSIIEGYLPSNLVDVEEAAEILDLSAIRIRQLAKAGDIGFQVGGKGKFIFCRRELARFSEQARPTGIHRRKSQG